MRFRNSGLKRFFISPSTLSFIFWYCVLARLASSSRRVEAKVALAADQLRARRSTS